mgnify:CR=1 FL=1
MNHHLENYYSGDLVWLSLEIFPLLEHITIKLKTMKETETFLERFPKIGEIQY